MHPFEYQCEIRWRTLCLVKPNPTCRKQYNREHLITDAYIQLFLSKMDDSLSITPAYKYIMGAIMLSITPVKTYACSFHCIYVNVWHLSIRSYMYVIFCHQSCLNCYLKHTFITYVILAKRIIVVSSQKSASFFYEEKHAGTDIWTFSRGRAIPNDQYYG